MSIYIAHRRRKTSNALDTLVLSEQECFQWTSERLVTTRRITEVSRQRIPSHWSSDSEGPTTKNNTKLVHCYIWYSEDGPGRAMAPPSPLLAVPNVTAHPSTASVPITLLLYDSPLLCGFNVVIKGLKVHAGQRRPLLTDRWTFVTVYRTFYFNITLPKYFLIIMVTTITYCNSTQWNYNK